MIIHQQVLREFEDEIDNQPNSENRVSSLTDQLHDLNTLMSGIYEEQY